MEFVRGNVMRKTALKNLATIARKECQKKVAASALKLGITEATISTEKLSVSKDIFINGKQFSEKEQIQRNKLIERMQQLGFHQVIDEVAYIWFKRFIALRFMEVNDYLPIKMRALSSSNKNSIEPDMMREALTLDLQLDKEYVYELKMTNQQEELFKYLIIKLCNDLNSSMPFMFETIDDDDSNILFPDGLLAADSFVRQMIDTTIIPESDWKKIEIIGWLYQYYISEEKDRVFKMKKKYHANDIPYATQLFTPEWIVRYLVQNSLGRYWIETHPQHQDLIDGWEFYINHSDRISNSTYQSTTSIRTNENIKDLKCFDPAMGSGHILVYMFDVLYEIYQKCGYLEREIPRLIIENNLYGLDIDDRAYQLACFSVVMKAMQYNRRFLKSIKRDGLSLNLASIQETNDLTEEDIAYVVGKGDQEDFLKVKQLVEQFYDAKTIGSLLKINKHDFTWLQNRLTTLQTTTVTDLFVSEKRDKILLLFSEIMKQTQIMRETYDILVTNPPYMSARRMNNELSQFLRKYYPDSKTDLFAAFMEIDHYMKKAGLFACINQHSWMFLSSYEKLRDKTLKTKQIDSMLHLGTRTFEEIGGEIVQSTAFVLRYQKKSHLQGIYIRLVEDSTSAIKKEKTLRAIQNPSVSYRYAVNQDNFRHIPGDPIAYWASERTKEIFSNNKKLREIAKPRQGLATADNDRFLRFWYETNIEKIGFHCQDTEEALTSGKKWFPYNKGGSYRKWYGNQEYVVNWEHNGKEIKNFIDENGKQRSRPQNTSYYFKESITWSFVSSADFGVRYSPAGSIFDVGGSSLFPVQKDIKLLTGLLSSKLSHYFLANLNPTLNFQVGNVGSIPLPAEKLHIDQVVKLTNECIAISKNDWDAFETSWDFKQHPLFVHKGEAKTIEEAFNRWAEFAKTQFNQLKINEEKINQLFINMYGLQKELTAEVNEADIIVRKANRERDIKSLISYAVGCIFGRYSLNEEGLVFAGGKLDSTRYKTIKPDKDNILPIVDGDYFENDIVMMFVDFVRQTFGENKLEENLNFIARSLNNRQGETTRETIRRYFMNDFYKDHLRTYKKRPIYWLFTSGKEKAFHCLIYMHRYDNTTLSRIRSDYLHAYETRLYAYKNSLLELIASGETSQEINLAKRELTSLDKKIEELKVYDEILHHLADKLIEIDFDDGVKKNYEKFSKIVAKI